MSRTVKTNIALLALAALATMANAQTGTPAQTNAIKTAAPQKKVEPVLAWHDPTNWGVEGKGWTEGFAHFYDRLPARAQITASGIWGLSRESAGLSVRFETDAPYIYVRYHLTSTNLTHGWEDFANMTGSGVDLYAQAPDPANGKHVWSWVGGNKPKTNIGTDCLVNGLAPGKRQYVLNLPVYNGVESLEIGVPTNATFAGVAPRTALPIVFYGTSIMQGGVASRPGLVIPAFVGRRLDRPTVNMGFCGSGKMQPAVVDLLAEIKAAAYVVDCIPNMFVPDITERTEPLVRRLREAHPDTPILLVEHHDYPSPESLLPRQTKDIRERNAALRAAYDRLVKAGVKHLYYLPGHDLVGTDSEGTGDGVHPNALGTFRYVEAYTAALKEILQ